MEGGVRELLESPEDVPPSAKYLLLRQPDFYGFVPGMFSVFNGVLGCLDLYEQKSYGGIGVYFAGEGLYFEPKKGSNWWTYYCEPLDLGRKDKLKIVIYSCIEYMERMNHAEYHLSRERAHDLINRYIRFKDDVLDKVDQFCDEHFLAPYTIGIHYRGTDKDSEAPRVEYKKVMEAILDHLQTVSPLDFQIFVATDEAQFIKAMLEAFPGKVVYLPAERSRNGLPIHYTTQNRYQQGLDSILDCHILSRADLIIRTSSNLSLWSTYLNPEIPQILLNGRYELGEK